MGIEDKLMDEKEKDISSVKLTKNAKGDFQWEIKIYGEDDDQTLQRINKINEELEAKYGQQ